MLKRQLPRIISPHLGSHVENVPAVRLPVVNSRTAFEQKFHGWEMATLHSTTCSASAGNTATSPCRQHWMNALEN
jgi:hypothetical protein